MKKTLIIAAVTAFISTGAMAKPSTNHTPAPHSSHSVQTVSHSHKAAPKSHHASHHSSKVYVVNSRPTPPPHRHHHHHNSLDLGDALIAFAILATAF